MGIPEPDFGRQCRLAPVWGVASPVALRGWFEPTPGLLGRVEGDLDVLLVDALLDLGRGGQRAPVGLEERV